MKKIVIGVPLVEKHVHPDFVKSLVGSVYAGAKSDIEFFVDFESNSNEIDMNKNIIANRVMNSTVVDGVVFLSPTLSWKPKDLLLLIEHEKEVVSAVFPEATTYKELYDIKLLEDQDINGEILKAEYVNMKACYVSKTAFMKAADHCAISGDNDFYYFFIPTVANGIYDPSAVGFCKSLLDAGVEINVEKTANFGNIGEIQFDGNYEKAIQKEWVNDQAEMQDVERGLI